MYIVHDAVYSSTTNLKVAVHTARLNLAVTQNVLARVCPPSIGHEVTPASAGKYVQCAPSIHTSEAQIVMLL